MDNVAEWLFTVKVCVWQRKCPLTVHFLGCTQDTPEGNSLYKVQAVDRDLGSGGSVSYFLQVNQLFPEYLPRLNNCLSVCPYVTFRLVLNRDNPHPYTQGRSGKKRGG